MHKLAALVSGLGWHVQDLRRAARELGISLAALPFPTITGRVGNRAAAVEAGGIDLTSLDGILIRMMPPGSLEQVIFRMDALHRLEALGVPVLNPPRAVETAVDKYLALARLEADGLPVPDTWVGESADNALAAFERLGCDVVVKPLFGSEGRGLVRVSDVELARRTFHTLARLGSVLYVQRFVRHPGYDLRAFVLGDRVIGAIRRDASGGDWRTNVAVGGTARKVSLGEEIESMAVRAAKAVGARMAGVDLLPEVDHDGFTVIEVNAVPGWKALVSATRIDVAQMILRELLDHRR